jgi:hypothetical protein
MTCLVLPLTDTTAPFMLPLTDTTAPFMVHEVTVATTPFIAVIVFVCQTG